MISVSSFSQNWQPKKIVYGNEVGLFLPFSIMDSISFKLIERNSLISQNLSLGKLIRVLQDKNDELVQKTLKLSNTSLKWQLLYEKESEKSLLLTENIIDQKQITVNTKRRARRNGLYLFGGGVAVGITVFAILVD